MINRICIIGGPGSGKSTLTNELSKILKIPATHIDELYENKDWNFEDRDKIKNELINIINNTNQWIIDGTYIDGSYAGTLEQRLERCDLMLYLDFSTGKLLKGISKRRIQNINITKKKLGWNEKMSLDFIKYVVCFNFKKRKIIKSILNNNKKCIILKNRKEVILVKKLLENIVDCDTTALRSV